MVHIYVLGYSWNPKPSLGSMELSPDEIDVSPGRPWSITVTCPILFSVSTMLTDVLAAMMAISPNTPFGPSKNDTDVTASKSLLAAWISNCETNNMHWLYCQMVKIRGRCKTEKAE